MSRRPRLPSGVRARANKDGTVVFQARWRDRSGQQHSRTFDTARQARDHLEDERRRMRDGHSGDPTLGFITVSEWWQMCLAERQDRPSTVTRDISYVNNHVLPVWGDVRLCDVTHTDGVRWVKKLSTKKLALSTQAKIVSIFKGIMSRATADGRLPVNPLVRLEGPKIPRIEAEFLDDDQLLALEQAMDPWWSLVIPFVADTGLRIGEVSALRVRDVDLDNGIVRVRTGAVYVSKKVTGLQHARIEDNAKTTAAIRSVPTLTTDVADRLRAMIAERSLGADDLLFTGQQGGPLRPTNFRRRVFHPAVQKAGLAYKRVQTHSVRHSAVARWIAADVREPYKLSRWAGHSSILTIYRLYGHMLTEPEDDVRNRLQNRRTNATDAANQAKQAGLRIVEDGD